VITSPAFRGRRYAVLGLARSGRATVEALSASGADVLAWDKNEEARRSVAGNVKLGDPLTADLAGYDGIVVSPGVPLNRHPIADKAREAGVPLIGDIELFAQARASLPPHKVVGITGTNGKSTTTALVHHILKTAGVPTTMAGNIGYPILGQDPLPAGGVYVLELSSYQIDLTYSLDCDVAVLLNITPDHLDRYDGFEAYRNSKLRLFDMQDIGTGLAIVPDEDRQLWRHLIEKVQQVNLAFISSTDFESGRNPGFDPSSWQGLQGPHNKLNASAAYLVTRGLGITDDVIDQAFRTYPGLPHRMERVREQEGVLFVNDSKATNPDSAAPALAAYDAVHWIVGGLAKTEDLGPCERHLGHVRAAYTIGEAGPMFARLLEGKVPVRQCEMLIEAVQRAAEAAAPGEVVLLSPACASFDQFRDYEARGDAFRAAVEALSERVGA
jgi:UDP-N-acetylmuramoylalanine--D-glutamate ligase